MSMIRKLMRNVARSVGKRMDPLEDMGMETEKPASSPVKKKEPLTEADWKMLRAEELLLSLTATGLLPDDLVQEEDFSDPELKIVYQDLKKGASPASLLDRAEDGETRSRLARLLLTPQAGSTDELIVMAQDCVAAIRRGRYEKKMKEIMDRLPNCTDEAEKMGLLAEYQALSVSLRGM